MKKVIFLLLLFAFVSNSFAQQFPQFSHNMFNMMTINPGFAGSSGEMRATLIGRQQWVGLEGAPNTNLFSIDAATNLFGIRSGVGLNVIQDKIGFDNDFFLNLAYSYRTDLGAGTLGVGVGLGLASISLKPNWFIPEGDNFTPAESDLAIPDESSKMGFDLNAGIYYYTAKYYLGASTTHITQTQFDLLKGTPSLARHYFFTGGVTFPLPFPQYEITPSAFVKFDGTAAQYSVNALVTYNKKIWGGITYRLGDAVVAMAGIKLLNGLKIGYAYDLSINKLSSYNNGSHEIMVNYQFNINFDKTPQLTKSVRFL
jgi:type IX secretion system PorP/SprF family membrane protein